MWWKWGGRRRPGSSRAAGSCATWASPENSALKFRAGRSRQARRCRLIVRTTPEKIHSKTALPTRFRSRALMPLRWDHGRLTGGTLGSRLTGRAAATLTNGRPRCSATVPPAELDLVDDEGIDALVADRGRGVPEEHHRLHVRFREVRDRRAARPSSWPSSSFRARREPGGKSSRPIWRNSQARRPDRLLEVGDLEVDHFMAPRLEPPPQGRERIVVSRRGKTQDADTTHGSSSLVTFVLVPFIFDSGTRPCDRDCVGLNRMILTWKFDLLCFHVLGFCFFVRFRHKR